jgi:hypothetical protein
MIMETKTVLMSSDNHNGWKLEELLAQLKLEVTQKTNKIINDPSPQAQLVVRNNLSIITHLAEAEALQRTSYAVLDAMRENQGPGGKPRIGNREEMDGLEAFKEIRDAANQVVEAIESNDDLEIIQATSQFVQLMMKLEALK